MGSTYPGTIVGADGSLRMPAAAGTTGQALRISSTTGLLEWYTPSAGVALGDSPTWTGSHTFSQPLKVNAGAMYVGGTSGLLFSYLSGNASIANLVGNSLIIGLAAGPTIAINSTQGIINSTNVTFAASTTTRSSLNIPSGVAPTTPVDGDMWCIGDVMYRRISGVTKSITFA